MKKFSRILGLLLALTVLTLSLAGALAEEAALDLQASDEILATVNGAPVTRQDVEDIYGQLLEQYGSYYDMTLPDNIALFWQVAIQDAVYYVLLDQKEEELGFKTITPEDQALAEETWNSQVQAYAEQYFGLTENSTEDEKLAAETNTLALLEQNGYTKDVFIAQALNALPYERLLSYIVEGVVVDDAALQAHFDSLVANSKASYEADPAEYIFNKEYFDMMDPSYAAMFGLSRGYYNPAGYRGVIHILLTPGEGLLEAYHDLNDRLQAQLEAAEATATDAASGTDLGEPVTQEQVDAAYDAVIASVQETIDAINERLAQGESFESLIAAYGQDPGMEEEANLANGYSVHLDSVAWDPAFVKAAFSVNNVGDVAEPVVGSSGVHIVKYLRDVPAGPIELTDALKQELTEELQAQLENDSYQATFEAWMAEANTVYQEDGAAMHDGTYTTAPAIAVTAEPAE